MMKLHPFSVKSLTLTSAFALALAAPVAAIEDGAGNAPPTSAHPASGKEAGPQGMTVPPEKTAPAEKSAPAKKPEEEKGTKTEDQAAPEKSEEPESRPAPEEKAGKPEAKAEKGKAAKGETVDKEAVQAVMDMSKKLADLKSFSVKADMTWEEVLDNGEKILAVEQIDADVMPPQGLRMHRISPEKDRIFFYDGKKAVLWGPVTRYYTTLPFSGSLAELVAHLNEKYNYELPLADLFLWGHDKSDVEKLKSATYIGEDMIGDRLCDHYAFRQENVDWQIWIEKSEEGLPCRYAIIDLTDPARPLFEATVKIDPEAEFFDKRFTFAAPKDAAKIPMETAEELRKQQMEEEKKQE